MFSLSNEAEQRDLWHLAVPRRKEGVHRSDCRDQSNAKKIRELAPSTLLRGSGFVTQNLCATHRARRVFEIGNFI